ncbi:sensor histidine kinase [Bacillaceae bacterium S4-13-56]
MRISLQTKIVTLITALILLVTTMITVFNGYYEWKQTEDNIGKRALNVATAISYMPAIRDAFSLEEPSTVIQPLAERIRKDIGAEFIVVGNKDSIRYSHPEAYKIGRKMVGGDNGKALIDGEYYTSEAVGSLGPSLRGKAPIFNDNGNIIGIVSVGFMIEDIKTIIFNRLLKLSFFSFLVLIIGIFGGVMLARNIRKEIMGLEPYQIASLYRDRSAILSSIKEGIIAMDQHGNISMMNQSAEKILGLSNKAIGKPVDEVIPNSQMNKVLKSGSTVKDEELYLSDRVVILNTTPIFEDGNIVGAVASFRDKTEVKEMLNTLSEVRRYSEDLRAQTHEYTNKLYVLSGLLQLGHYKEAVELIQTESNLHMNQTEVVFNRIKDRTVQAILLGKIGKASEKKIELDIDHSSSLEKIPKHIDISKLITILGNLLDNAMEAVCSQKDRKITFFSTDIGDDIVFEVADSGHGISEENMKQIFEIGFSTKGEENRGFGLSIVKEIVDDLQGTIEIQSDKDGGTVFSVFIPKVLGKEQSA